MTLSWNLVLGTAFFKKRAHTFSIDKEKHIHTQPVCLFQTLITEGNEDPRVPHLCFLRGKFSPSPVAGSLRVFGALPHRGLSSYQEWTNVNAWRSPGVSKWLAWPRWESTSVIARGQRGPGLAPALRSHDTGLNVLADALVVVVVVVGAAGRGVEGGDAVEVEDEVFPVAHRRGVVLVSREPHWKGREEKRSSETFAPLGRGLWFLKLSFNMHLFWLQAGGPVFLLLKTWERKPSPRMSEFQALATGWLWNSGLLFGFEGPTNTEHRPLTQKSGSPFLSSC